MAALMVDIKVVPSSGKNGWVLDKNGIIKCYLKNPAEHGLANKELIKTIAVACKVTQAEVSIIKGLTSPKKVIKIAKDLSKAQFMAMVGLAEQQATL